MIVQPNKIVDQTAEADFGGLVVALTALRSRSPQRGRSRSLAKASRDENQALDELIKAFEKVAGTYFGRAKEIIGRSKQNPKDQTYAYEQVLGRLIEHAHLLSDLARPHLQAKSDQGELSLVENRSRVEKVINIIAARVESPALFPIASPSYQYIHFNYMGGIAVIGMPPQVLATPSWNLSVLWHEVGGYGVALTRRRKDGFGEWAEDEKLSGLWPACRTLYKQSFLQNAVAKIEPALAGEGCPYQVFECDELRAYLEENTSWQVDWLAEFFEDLFGVQALGGAMVEVLADALAQRYECFGLGDDKHPPPNLRLQVALAYLDLVAPGTSKETMAHLSHHYSGPLPSGEESGQVNGLKHLQLDQLNDDLKEAAKTIARFYKGKVENGEFCKPTISPEEKKLAEAIGVARNRFFTQKEELAKILDDLYHQLDELEMQVVPSPEPLADFQEEVNAADDLKSLLAVRFAEVDRIAYPDGGGGGYSGIWPPPSG